VQALAKTAVQVAAQHRRHIVLRQQLRKEKQKQQGC